MNAELLKESLALGPENLISPALDDKQRMAAVLILIAPGDNGPELIFTKRSEALSRHAGQISFPGGSVEKNDPNPIFTAIRESEEEIGLLTENVEILGTLDWHTMPSGFVVLPVVGLLQKPQGFIADPGEVVDIFSLPLSELLDISLFQQDTNVRDNIKRTFYYIEIKGYYIWGATAAMLRTLVLKILDTA